MYGRVVEGVDPEGIRTMRVMDVLDVKQTGRREVTLEWAAGEANDMVADSAIALLLGIDSSPASVKLTTHPHLHDHAHEGESKEGQEHEHEDKAQISSTDSSKTSEPILPHPLSNKAPVPAASTKTAGVSDVTEEQTYQAAALARAEHIAAFLEAHFGAVEEVMLGLPGEGKEEEETRRAGEGEDAEMGEATEGEVKVKTEGGEADADVQEEGKLSAPANEDTEMVDGAAEERKAGDGDVKNAASATMEQRPPRPALRVWLDEQTATIDLTTLVSLAARTISLPQCY